jgi:hypothetical protein
MATDKETLMIRTGEEPDGGLHGALPISRKAELFDGIMESIDGNDPGENWYDMLIEIGMKEAEMRALKLDLPELKILPESAKAMVDIIISEILKTKMEGHQLYIEFSVSELASRCDCNPSSCSYANDMFYEEIATREEIANAEILYDRLLVMPVPNLIERLHHLDSSGLTREG